LDGDTALLLLLEDEDNVLETVLPAIGLPSCEFDGEEVEEFELLFELCSASVLRRCMTSLFAFSNTGKFLKENEPKSSTTTLSLNRRLRPPLSRT